MREFEIATGRAALVQTDDIVFKLGDREITAHAPTLGQLALFLQGGARGGMNSITGLIEFISDVVSDRDWRFIQRQLRDGLDVDVLSQISSYLIGEWSGRPTLLASVSGTTPGDTGQPSTESVPSVELISFDSPSTDSSTPSNGGRSSESRTQPSGSRS